MSVLDKELPDLGSTWNNDTEGLQDHGMSINGKKSVETRLFQEHFQFWCYSFRFSIVRKVSELCIKQNSNS